MKAFNLCQNLAVVCARADCGGIEYEGFAKSSDPIMQSYSLDDLREMSVNCKKFNVTQYIRDTTSQFVSRYTKETTYTCAVGEQSDDTMMSVALVYSIRGEMLDDDCNVGDKTLDIFVHNYMHMVKECPSCGSNTRKLFVNLDRVRTVQSVQYKKNYMKAFDMTCPFTDDLTLVPVGSEITSSAYKAQSNGALMRCHAFILTLEDKPAKTIFDNNIDMVIADCLITNPSPFAIMCNLLQLYVCSIFYDEKREISLSEMQKKIEDFADLIAHKYSPLKSEDIEAFMFIVEIAATCENWLEAPYTLDNDYVTPIPLNMNVHKRSTKMRVLDPKKPITGPMPGSNKGWCMTALYFAMVAALSQQVKNLSMSEFISCIYAFGGDTDTNAEIAAAPFFLRTRKIDELYLRHMEKTLQFQADHDFSVSDIINSLNI